jgi:hypothetical protein
MKTAQLCSMKFTRDVRDGAGRQSLPAAQAVEHGIRGAAVACVRGGAGPDRRG